VKYLLIFKQITLSLITLLIAIPLTYRFIEPHPQNDPALIRILFDAMPWLIVGTGLYVTIEMLSTRGREPKNAIHVISSDKTTVTRVFALGIALILISGAIALGSASMAIHGLLIVPAFVVDVIVPLVQFSGIAMIAYGILVLVRRQSD